MHMLFLLFSLDEARYALPARQIVELLPYLPLRPWPRCAAAVAGLIDYRGTPMPVLDLSQLLLGRPAPRRMSTRLLVVRHPHAQGEPRLLGLLAEQATDTARLAPQSFVAPALCPAGAPGLGGLAVAAQGQLQRVELAQLLPAATLDALFADEAATAWPAN